MAEHPSPTQDTTKPTVREQLVEALEWLVEHAPVACAKPVCGRCVLLEAKAATALDRARAEPECADRESTCPDCGTDCPCYQDGANEGHSSGCNDDSCTCWAAGHQEGLEAPREPAGRGTV